MAALVAALPRIIIDLPIFTLIYAVTVFVHLHYAATYRPFCKLFGTRLPTYWIMARNFDFLLQISGFHLTLPCIIYTHIR